MPQRRPKQSRGLRGHDIHHPRRVHEHPQAFMRMAILILMVSGRRTHIDTARTGDSGGAKVPAGKQPGELMLTRTSCPFSENGAGTIYCKRAAGL